MPRRRHRDQSGFTLMEVLIALVLVTFIVIALADGLLTNIRVDASFKDRQRRTAALTSFGEALRNLSYRPCADTLWYQKSYEDAVAGVIDEAGKPLLDLRREKFGLLAGSTVAVKKIEYWVPEEYPVDANYQLDDPKMGTWQEICDEDSGTQRLDISVTYKGSTSDATVVMRNHGGMAVQQFLDPIRPVPGNVRPRASFTAEQISPVPAPVDFEFTPDATDGDGTVTKLIWDYGDGISGEQTPDAGSFPPVAHTYYPGTYMVRLTVVDDSGGQTTVARSISVPGKPLAVPSCAEQPTNCFRLLRQRTTGGSTRSYDFAWPAVPGVFEYEVRIRYCVHSWARFPAWLGGGTIFDDTSCADGDTQRFGSPGGTMNYDWSRTPRWGNLINWGGFDSSIFGSYGIEYYGLATIRARVGEAWGPATVDRFDIDW